LIPNRVDISERPLIVEEKCRLGDFELDTIVGQGQTSSIVSIVDRASKYVMLVKVFRKTAQNVEDALIARLSPFKEHVLTLTADNGKEFAYHERVSQTLDTGFFFATPYHSWERGLNEHTNGLVRQYFPKGICFDDITPEMIAYVEDLINNRPRKVLGYETPMYVFKKMISKLKERAI
jgi:IS30 family transposase